jgi:hypothetical protein
MTAVPVLTGRPDSFGPANRVNYQIRPGTVVGLALVKGLVELHRQSLKLWRMR